MCSGNSLETCGGSAYFSVYSTSKIFSKIEINCFWYKYFLLKELNCSSTTCPFALGFGGCVPLTGSINQCTCPIQNEGDQCQYGNQLKNI